MVAVAGDTFAVIAADTRLSKDYQILSRNTSRVWELSPGVWVGMGGCTADILALVETLRMQAKLYAWKNGGKPISLNAMAHLISATLYGRRTMPYYAFCVLAGVDEHGAGAVYAYDAVGSVEKVRAACVGGAQPIILPILDQLVARAEPRAGPMEVGAETEAAGEGAREGSETGRGGRAYDGGDESGEAYFQRWSDSGSSPTAHRPTKSIGLPLGAAIDGIKGAVAAAAERDIRLGDRLEIVSIDSTSPVLARREEDLQLKAH